MLAVIFCRLAAMKVTMKTEQRYILIRSNRKTVAIQIQPNGQVLVRAPKGMPEAVIDNFVNSKTEWIRKQLNKLPVVRKLTNLELRELVYQAKTVLPQRVAYYAPLVGVTYQAVSIRKQRTRWGSCSGKGNLNFNCLLMLAPPEVVDYVVVHELCHRKEMNHSPAFWAEVERILPDYRKRKRWLKDNGQALIDQLR